VAPLRFDRIRIQAFLELAGERLVGEWLLIGGGAAATWFAPSRTTEDVDLIGLAGTQDERFALMQLAVDASLPVEAVNSAADFFVRKVAGWRDELVPLHRGARATIYRPSATLFLLLKINRLSEVDFADCLALDEHRRAHGDALDLERVLQALRALPDTDDAALAARRASMLDALQR
jgi:hypothetical protein